MTLDLLGEGDFELRGVVRPLALFCRHLALLALCHLFSRQATRKSDILYTYSVVAFGLALSLRAITSLNKRHDLYLIASLWVVSKENAGKASVGVAALPGASACKLWQERRELGRE